MTLTLPFRFHVPTKITHGLVVEYSAELKTFSVSYPPEINGALNRPLFQSSSDVVVDRIVNCDLELVGEISLAFQESINTWLGVSRV